MLVARNLDRETRLGEAIEDARSFGMRFRGLMGRATLPAGSGMWFGGTSGIHMLFMRFPIDCLFLGPVDETGIRRVVSVRAALPPWRGIVWYVRGAQGVLEVPTGTIDASGTIVGDRVSLEAPRLPS